MIYSIENEFIKASVKTKGSELTSLILNESGREYLWQGDPSVWQGQSPVLFPIIGRVLNDKYRLNGKEYDMEKHGFFRRRESVLYSKESDKITLLQKSDFGTLKIYPYEFELYVTFELINNSIKVTHTVVNKTSRIMYFSIGAHPAFNCSIGDYILFEKNENLSTNVIDKECLRTGETVPVLKHSRKIEITDGIFNNDALIFGDMRSSYVILESAEGRFKVKFDYGGSPYLGIWSKPKAPFVCLEPWWGINDSHERNDDFSNKDAIQNVPSRKSFSCYWKAELS